MNSVATEAPGIATETVVPWLLEHVDGLRPPLHFARVGEGQSNLTYRIDDGTARSVVLRRPPLGEILQSAHDMLREHHILTGLATAAMPTPRPLAACEDAVVTGAPFYVMEHVAGHVLTSVDVARKLPATGRAAAGASLARTLAKLQTIDLDGAGLGDLKRSSPYARRQLRRWHGQWEASRTRDLPAIDALAARFEAGLPPEDETVLVHGDYRLDNAVIGTNGEVLAVLDWELCTVGPPLADVGLMIAYWNEQGAAARQPAAMFREAVTEVPGFPSTDELIAAYAQASGRDMTGLGAWIAFAYWKIAIILEGVYRRWLNNPANGSGAGALGDAVPRIVALAMLAADEADL